MLGEDPAGIGSLLWDCARAVVLWAETPRRELDAVFAPAAERMLRAALFVAALDPAAETPLLELATLAGNPRNAGRDRVGLACRRVSRWADSQAAVATAFVFAEAAACVCPGNANLAYEAGRLARRRAEYTRAETWLRRAVLLGRQTGDWETYARAFSGLGNLFVQRGNYPRARKYHTRCLQSARQHGLRSLEGEANHDLCGIAIEVGQIEEVNAYARAAYEAYGEGHARLPILAHDVADGWMDQGYFSRALAVFDAVLPHCISHERVPVLANICRAAGGIGDSSRFEQAWMDAWSFIGSTTTQEYLAQALLDLARGAASQNQWERAEMAARRSLELAMERREARIRITAEAIIDSILHERTTETQTTTVTDSGVVETVRVLADDFTRCLQHATAGT